MGTTVGGVNYNDIGSSSSPLLLKSNGTVRVQWGNKFIDLIKNGKIASESSKILKVIDNKDDIKDDGIYLVNNEEAWLSIGGATLNLSGLLDTTYVSFMTELEIDAEQKYRALNNIGFYYETLEDAKSLGINTGIVYIPSEGKLYIAINGSFSEYSSEKLQDESLNKLSELLIGNLKIYDNSGDSIFDAKQKISLQIGSLDFMTLSNLKVLFKKDIIADYNTYFLSVDANKNRGFRLYNTSLGSVLEVDSILWRNIDSLLASYTRILDEFLFFGKDNIILKGKFGRNITIENVEYKTVLCELKYRREYFKDDFIFVNMTDSKNPLNKAMLYEYKIYNIPITENDIINPDTGMTPEPGPKTRAVSDDSEIVYTVANAIEVLIKSSEYDFFIENCAGSLICKSNTYVIKCKDYNLEVLDRSKKILDENNKEIFDETVHTKIGVIKEDEISLLKTCPEKTTTPDVGVFSDNFIGLNSKLYDPTFKKLCNYPSYDENIVIPESFGDELYNQVVPNIAWIKELLKLAIPSGTIVMYNGETEPPEGWIVCDGQPHEYNGIMYTAPDLRGKFIKGVGSIQERGEVETELDENNNLILKKENLPDHSHPHISHTHKLGTTTVNGTTELSSELDFGEYIKNVEVYDDSNRKSVITSVSGTNIGYQASEINEIKRITREKVKGGTHSHTYRTDLSNVLINHFTSLEDTNKKFENLAIKIEPRAYALVYIMKV